MRGMAAVLLAAGAAACASAGAGPFAETVYVCQDGRSFTAEVTPTRATVRADGRVHHLQRTERMGPDHYTSGRVNFYADRVAARLDTGEALYAFCRRAEPA
jgi:uncharacterized protein YfaQ (DUF2300 family)